MTSQPENHVFQAEVSRLLDIVVHALYSQREIFLRELISNAADASDKLRYEALKNPALNTGTKSAIHLVADSEAGTLTVCDNGIGMSRDDMVENLGTIARSGTKAFLEKLEQQGATKDVNLIGQFGVGFYSAFMVADEVEVISRRAGTDEAWRWVSQGKGAFTLEAASKNLPGTDVILHLKDDAREYVEEGRLKEVVKAYSDHIPLPIYYGDDESLQLNRASALWMRGKTDITAEEHREFYHHVAHAYDEPALTLHWRAEGTLEYTGLLYVPAERPLDLFDPRRQHRVKLYVKRVFITDAAEGLLPPYLRFLKGVIDSEDLPLNISREMLQNNPVLTKMRQGITKRVLAELEKFSADAEAYVKFWETFGAVLKEGLYDDYENRAALLKLVRVHSTHGEGLTTLADYIARMPEGQKNIYYINGDNAATLARSPQLEGYRARGIEVVLFDHPIDDFWIGVVDNVDGKPFASVTRGENDLDKIKPAPEKLKDEKEAPEKDVKGLIAVLKNLYGEAVRDVRVSKRLTDSPVCLVAAEGELDIHLERLLRQNKALNVAPARILEINPGHPLIARMAALPESDTQADMAWLLLDQARLLEGEALADPLAFSQRLTRLGLKGMA